MCAAIAILMHHVIILAAFSIAASADKRSPGDDEVCSAGSSCMDGAGSFKGGHYWPRRGGNLLGNGFTPHAGPSNLSEAPAWQWSNEDDELSRHGPVIDDQGNIYTVTAQGWVRKFSPDGVVLWAWRTRKGEGRVVTCLSLYNNSVHFMSVGGNFSGHGLRFVGGYAFALSMQSGELLWRSEMPQHFQEPDSHTVFTADGVFLAAMRDRTKEEVVSEGNNKVVALTTGDGSFLWDYDLDGVVWNFMPSTPGDGTVLFATSCGRAHRLDLQTGKLLWKASFAEPKVWCGTGGGALGPDGRFYVAANHFSEVTHESGTPFDDLAPCHPTDSGWDCPEGPGMFLVYRVDDGTIELKFRSPSKFNQYPAVGILNGKLSIVAGVGDNPKMPHFFFDYIKTFLPGFLKENVDLRVRIFEWQYKYAWVRRLLGFEIMADNFVVALDAATGALLWSFKEEPWDHYAAAGEEERFTQRYSRRLSDYRVETVCGPDSWAIPVITGDGTVYAASGITGNLYAIRDEDGNGVLDPGDVSTFATGQAFLNAPALAPGMLAAAPCWGPMYVWTKAA